MTTARCHSRAGGWLTRCTRWLTRSRSGLAACAGGRTPCTPGCGVRCAAGPVRRSGARRTAPCRIDVLTLLVDVDGTVAGWEPDGKGTLDRLRTLVGRGWRPQDCQLIENHCAQLEKWVLAATDLLDRRPVVSLHVPCPRCGARFAYRDSAGEQVRVRALRVSELGCKCLSCGAAWAPSEFHWLARLLGCDPLPA